MLLSLSQWLLALNPEWGFLRVFQYLTFRAVMSAMTALLIGLGLGPWVIRRLTELKIGQPIREYGVQAHLAKRGTPIMGGVLILLGIGVATLLWFDWSNRFVWVMMLVTFGFGAVGWVDDWRKVVDKNPEGMRSREKFFWQSLIGLLAAVVQGLAAFRPVAGRSRLLPLQLAGRAVTLVDDSYNANPDSVRAAIDVLATLPAPQWLVLGDMGEVGDQGPAFHAEVGAHARAAGIAHLWAAGSACIDAARAFGPDARHFADAAAVVAALNEAPACGAVLVKGSKFMRMPTVVAALQKQADAGGAACC